MPICSTPFHSLATMNSVVLVGPPRATEKAGRLKLNGELTSYSPLSRVVELEGLLTGITGKKGLWNALLQIAPTEPRLDADRLERLRDRAEAQRATVEDLRQRAAREAFAA